MDNNWCMRKNSDGYIEINLDPAVFLNRIRSMNLTVEEYVNRYYEDCGSPLSGLNNVKVDTIIFTNDVEKADKKLNEIYNNHKSEVARFIKGSWTSEIWLNDGSRYIWLRPLPGSKGYRCRKAIIDRNINFDDFLNYIDGVCLYCGKKDVSFF